MKHNCLKALFHMDVGHSLEDAKNVALLPVIENGKISAKWFVVSESGAGDLSGLRGEEQIRRSIASDVSLDDWFK